MLHEENLPELRVSFIDTFCVKCKVHVIEEGLLLRVGTTAKRPHWFVAWAMSFARELDRWLPLCGHLAVRRAPNWCFNGTLDGYMYRRRATTTGCGLVRKGGAGRLGNVRFHRGWSIYSNAFSPTT